MRLSRVTITGADDNTDISEMKELSAKYSFLEWGILVSAKHEGGPRFPSRKWIDKLYTEAVTTVPIGTTGLNDTQSSMNLSTHICGKWTREILRGEINWNDIPPCLGLGQRIQINTHGEEYVSKAGMLDKLSDPFIAYKVIIFQWDGVNQHLALSVMNEYGRPSVAALYDMSGGAGIEPECWPLPPKSIYQFGYAGGIGPENVLRHIAKIAALKPGGTPFWIDMERRVRAADDSYLDMTKVRTVLSQCADVLAAVCAA